MITHSNVPESVRSVASDGTKLRYALIEMAAQVKDAIALGRGDPDLATPAHIVAAAEDAMRHHIEAFRRNIIDKLSGVSEAALKR